MIYNITDIEILISTMNRDSLDFLVPMFSSHFSNFSILVINQTNKEKELTSHYSNVRVINSLEKGLSKSRNLAIKNAVRKILLIADDDIVYHQDFVSKIVNAYNQFPNAAVIKFCAVQSDGNLMKKYPFCTQKNLDIFSILDTSSIEISLNKRIIDIVNIKFDENFGLGSSFEIGEEAAFLSDLKTKNEQIVFVPKVIVKHNELTSSNKKKIIEKYYNQGALFTRIFKKKYVFWLYVKLFFDLKQNKIKLKNIIIALKSAKKGHEKFERMRHENKK